MSSEKTLEEVILSEKNPIIKAQFLNHYFKKLEKENGKPEQYAFASRQYLILYKLLNAKSPELGEIFSHKMIYCEEKSRL